MSLKKTPSSADKPKRPSSGFARTSRSLVAASLLGVGVMAMSPAAQAQQPGMMDKIKDRIGAEKDKIQTAGEEKVKNTMINWAKEVAEKILNALGLSPIDMEKIAPTVAMHVLLIWGTRRQFKGLNKSAAYAWGFPASAASVYGAEKMGIPPTALAVLLPLITAIILTQSVTRKSLFTKFRLIRQAQGLSEGLEFLDTDKLPGDMEDAMRSGTTTQPASPAAQSPANTADNNAPAPTVASQTPRRPVRQKTAGEMAARAALEKAEKRDPEGYN